MSTSTILANVQNVSAQFAADRGQRQLRRELDPADFAALADAGYLLSAVPVEMGGIWESVPCSTRPICELLRTIAHGDSSVALVAAMHPAVVGFWLATPDVPPPYQDAWTEQRTWIAATARDGAWWGTITSEPGSGGDISRTRTAADLDGAGQYTISGQKHFGSGLGISSYMMTTALPTGSTTPDLFFLELKDVPWDGSAGATLTAPWDGHGMIATQSHGMRFEHFPATRCAWPESITPLAEAVNPFINCLFTAVAVGIAEISLETARQRLQRRPPDSFRPFEQVEWTRATMEGWLIQQAYEGLLRAVEEDDHPLDTSVQAKTAIAELAESVTRRICRVLGGGTFSRHTPFGFWFEDVRALGFLRPPWALAYDNLFATAFPTPPS